MGYVEVVFEYHDGTQSCVKSDIEKSILDTVVTMGLQAAEKKPLANSTILCAQGIFSDEATMTNELTAFSVAKDFLREGGLLAEVPALVWDALESVYLRPSVSVPLAADKLLKASYNAQDWAKTFAIWAEAEQARFVRQRPVKLLSVQAYCLQVMSCWLAWMSWKVATLRVG